MRGPRGGGRGGLRVYACVRERANGVCNLGSSESMVESLENLGGGERYFITTN